MCESIENAVQIQLAVRFSYCIKAPQAGCSDKETLYFYILWGKYIPCQQCVEMKGLLEEHMVAGGWVAPCGALHSNRPPSDVQKMCTSRGGLWKVEETWCAVGCWLDGGAGQCRGGAPAVNLAHYYSRLALFYIALIIQITIHSLNYILLITLLILALFCNTLCATAKVIASANFL